MSGFREALERQRIAAQGATRNATLEGAELIALLAERQAPNLTGKLGRSIKATTPKAIGDAWESQIGPTAVYGRKIELGTHHPNPYLARGFAEAAPRLNAIYAKHWAQAL